MKALKFNKALLLTAFAGLAFTSCSNSDDGDVETPGNLTNYSFKLQKTAETFCSSNDYTLGQWEEWYQKLCDFEKNSDNDLKNGGHSAYIKYKAYAPSESEDRGEAVSQAEYDYVMQYLKDHKDEGSKEFEHYNYYIQLVGKGNATYQTTDWNNAVHTDMGPSKMDQLQVCDQNGNWKHFNDYNANDGKRTLVLNYKITDAKYHDSYGDQWYNYYKFYTIEYNGKKSMYLCFDYATHKDSGNEDLQPDGIYDDWVIKVIPCCDINDNGEPVDPTPDPDPVDPTPTPDPVDPTPTPDPVQPSYENKGLVEVNLSAQDHKDEECSKLSVHVRDTCNFKVFIPVPATAYCEADDMYIVEKHYDNMSYNEQTNVMEREIDGQKVTLTVSYVADGIYIESQGINAKVLEYCRRVYGDGITFEVWNYYNIKKLTREELLECLNKATIEFTDELPYKYVNTIVAKNVDTKGNLLDCTVTPTNWTAPTTTK